MAVTSIANAGSSKELTGCIANVDGTECAIPYALANIDGIEVVIPFEAKEESAIVTLKYNYKITIEVTIEGTTYPTDVGTTQVEVPIGTIVTAKNRAKTYKIYLNNTEISTADGSPAREVEFKINGDALFEGGKGNNSVSQNSMYVSGSVEVVSAT